MTERSSLRTAFLAHVGWGDAEITDLAGDASNRRYFRLHRGKDHAVLMDAPPDKGESVGPFVRIAQFLRAQGLSAPEILAEEQDAGFLLLEDLGDDLFARIVERDPAIEEELYCAAIDVLIQLHRAKLPTYIATYDPDLMAELAALAFDWYATGVSGGDVPNTKDSFVAQFSEALKALDGLDEVLIQRDYHAENLLWLPARSGVARVGLLDFQDAVAGHRAYDLVSLLQDARCDVSPALEAKMMDRYVDGTGTNRAAFDTAYALLGLQRNLRIIGVFARLCIRDAKPHYIDLIPRVWAHMMRDLKQAGLANLETVLMEALPVPDDQALDTLRQKCGTHQIQS